jgi:hypothetical protein
MSEVVSDIANRIQATDKIKMWGKKMKKLWSYHKQFSVFASVPRSSPLYIVLINGHTEMAGQEN